MNPPDTTISYYSVKYDTGYVHKRVTSENRFTPVGEVDTLSMSDSGMVIVNELGDTLLIVPSDRFYVAPEPPAAPIKTAFDSVQPHAALEPLLPGPSMAEKYASMLVSPKAASEEQYPWNTACSVLTVALAIWATVLFFVRIYEHTTESARIVRRNRHRTDRLPNA